MRLKLLLTTLLALPLAGCPEKQPAPVEGISYVFSGGRRLLAGHSHDGAQLQLGCQGCAEAICVAARLMARDEIRAVVEAARSQPARAPEVAPVGTGAR